MHPDNRGQYQLVLTNRDAVTVDGVEQVVTFDDAEIVLATKLGLLYLKGKGLSITQLNLDEGNLMVEGHIKSIDYSDEKAKGARTKGLLQRILK